MGEPPANTAIIMDNDDFYRNVLTSQFLEAQLLKFVKVVEGPITTTAMTMTDREHDERLLHLVDKHLTNQSSAGGTSFKSVDPFQALVNISLAVNVRMDKQPKSTEFTRLLQNLKKKTIKLLQTSKYEVVRKVRGNNNIIPVISMFERLKLKQRQLRVIQQQYIPYFQKMLDSNDTHVVSPLEFNDMFDNINDVLGAHVRLLDGCRISAENWDVMGFVNAFLDKLPDFCAAYRHQVRVSTVRTCKLMDLFKRNPEFEKKCAEISNLAKSSYDQLHAFNENSSNMIASTDDTFCLRSMLAADFQFFINLLEEMNRMHKTTQEEKLKIPTSAICAMLKDVVFSANSAAYTMGGEEVKKVKREMIRVLDGESQLLALKREQSVEARYKESEEWFKAKIKYVNVGSSGTPATYDLVYENTKPKRPSQLHIVSQQAGIPKADAERLYKACTGGESEVSKRRALRCSSPVLDTATNHIKWYVEGGTSEVRLLDACGLQYEDVKFEVRVVCRPKTKEEAEMSFLNKFLIGAGTGTATAGIIGTVVGGVGAVVFEAATQIRNQTWGSIITKDIPWSSTFRNCRYLTRQAVSRASGTLDNNQRLRLECAMALGSDLIESKYQAVDLVLEVCLIIGGGGQTVKRSILHSCKIPYKPKPLTGIGCEPTDADWQINTLALCPGFDPLLPYELEKRGLIAYTATDEESCNNKSNSETDPHKYSQKKSDHLNIEMHKLLDNAKELDYTYSEANTFAFNPMSYFHYSAENGQPKGNISNEALVSILARKRALQHGRSLTRILGKVYDITNFRVISCKSTELICEVPNVFCTIMDDVESSDSLNPSVDNSASKTPTEDLNNFLGLRISAGSNCGLNVYVDNKNWKKANTWYTINCKQGLHVVIGGLTPGTAYRIGLQPTSLIKPNKNPRICEHNVTTTQQQISNFTCVSRTNTVAVVEWTLSSSSPEVSLPKSSPSYFGMRHDVAAGIQHFCIEVLEQTNYGLGMVWNGNVEQTIYTSECRAKIRGLKPGKSYEFSVQPSDVDTGVMTRIKHRSNSSASTAPNVSKSKLSVTMLSEGGQSIVDKIFHKKEGLASILHNLKAITEEKKDTHPDIYAAVDSKIDTYSKKCKENPELANKKIEINLNTYSEKLMMQHIEKFLQDDSSLERLQVTMKYIEKAYRNCVLEVQYIIHTTPPRPEPRPAQQLEPSFFYSNLFRIDSQYKLQGAFQTHFNNKETSPFIAFSDDYDYKSSLDTLQVTMMLLRSMAYNVDVHLVPPDLVSSDQSRAAKLLLEIEHHTSSPYIDGIWDWRNSVNYLTVCANGQAQDNNTGGKNNTSIKEALLNIQAIVDENDSRKYDRILYVIQSDMEDHLSLGTSDEFIVSEGGHFAGLTNARVLYNKLSDMARAHPGARILILMVCDFAT